jgi:hypothetical protein
MAEEVKQQNENKLETTPKIIDDVEWCFQFFNNEPEVFAFSNEGEEAGNLAIELKPFEGEGLSFEHNGMSFKIFPRAISEQSKKNRAAENEGKN